MAERHVQISREKSSRAADVGNIPQTVDVARRERCRDNLHEFLQVYFPYSTGLSEFSEDHNKAIERIQIAMRGGGFRVLNLFPRGFGKTTISVNSAIWAVLYGHCKFIVVIGASEDSAKRMVESVKSELYNNDLLLEDFPEVVIPVRKLENKAQRCASQHHRGRLTYINWGMDAITMPSMQLDGVFTPASGGTILARGITGEFRGLVRKRPDGVNQRPDFVIIDDPQTGQSAKSPAQCSKRLDFIRKGALRLGGHNRQISAVMNATIIETDDVVEQLQDHNKHPEWEGVRIPMLKSLSDAHETLWLEEYADIRKQFNKETVGDRKRAIERSNTFYKENRHEMDKGAEATWPGCYSEGELSAIQHAYNILIDEGADVFASECQNQPERLGVNSEFLSATEIETLRAGKWEAFPHDTQAIGWHIDVQKRLLYWSVVAVTADFRIFVKYGTYPEQRNHNFEYRAVRKSIQQVHKGLSEEKAVKAALLELITYLSGMAWPTDDGRDMVADIGLVDGGYLTGTVQEAIDESGCRNVYRLFGRGVRAGDVPILQRQKQKLESRSQDPAIPWTMKPDQTNRKVRNVFNDTNAAKTFLHRRLATDTGLPGSVELPKGDNRRFCEHLASSEYPTETTGPHGKCVEWRLLPGAPDNHWLDTFCGSLVAASMSGKVAFAAPVLQKKPRNRKRVAYL